MTNHEQLPVIYRKFHTGGDIVALFPTVQDSQYFCMSYMHVGQHGGADYVGLQSITSLAAPDEYSELHSELVAIGYDNLKVVKVCTPKMRADFLSNMQ